MARICPPDILHARIILRMPGKKEIILPAACALMLVLAPVFSFPQWFLSFLILFSVCALGYAAGRTIEAGRVERFLWGTLGTTAALMLVRGAWFYLGFNLNGWGDVAPVAVTMILGGVWLGINAAAPAVGARHAAPLRRGTMILSITSAFLSLLALALISYAAWRSGTSESVRTPWPLLPEWVLPLIGLLWAFALAGAWKLKNRMVSAIQTGSAIASTAFITPLLYKIGYGFDGFLHIAGEKVLFATGTLNPKPAYYMGQYVFTTWLSKLFELDVALIDRWLVPAAAAVLIPAAMMLVAKNRPATILTSLILVPIAALAATTPHGFATVLGVTALILCIPRTTHHAPLAILFALWSALTHPLVGLPILFATVMAIVHSRKKHRAQRGAMWALAILAGFSVPIVFGLATRIGSPAGVSFDIGNLFRWESWQSVVSSWIPWVGNRFAVWPEASVWAEKLLPWITVIFAFLGIRRAKREGRKEPPWLAAALSTAMAAGILTMAGDFNFLIDYERGNYAERLWMVAWLLLLPLAVPELGLRLEKAKSASFASVLAVLASLGILGAGMSYAALPRHDAVTPSRGWSVGVADIEAVKLIDEDAAGRPYTVLANQSVSAAAVKTYGFKRYNGDVFFYPIPTGGELYKLFLRASYEDPSRDTLAEAARLGGSDLAYLVVNDYWWDADELIERAKSQANRSFEIGDGKAWVFRYDLTEPVNVPESEG
jgi:hypothetical protein